MHVELSVITEITQGHLVYQTMTSQKTTIRFLNEFSLFLQILSDQQISTVQTHTVVARSGRALPTHFPPT